MNHTPGTMYVCRMSGPGGWKFGSSFDDPASAWIYPRANDVLLVLGSVERHGVGWGGEYLICLCRGALVEFSLMWFDAMNMLEEVKL